MFSGESFLKLSVIKFLVRYRYMFPWWGWKKVGLILSELTTPEFKEMLKMMIIQNTLSFPFRSILASQVWNANLIFKLVQQETAHTSVFHTVYSTWSPSYIYANCKHRTAVCSVYYIVLASVETRCCCRTLWQFSFFLKRQPAKFP